MRRILLVTVAAGLALSACQEFRTSVEQVLLETPVAAQTLAPIPTDIPVGEAEVIQQPPATPTEAPFISALFRLTEAGCCVQPFWSADASMVLFIDKPLPTSASGIYGVSAEGGDVALVSERIAYPSPDGQYRAYLRDTGETIVEPMSGDPQWIVPSGGRPVYFSPGSQRLAWTRTQQSGNFDQRETVISVADIDGSEARELITIYGGGIGGWLDDERLLVVGRSRGQSQDVTLFSYSVIDGTRQDIISNQRIRTVRIAPGGEWISYTIAMDPDGIEETGVWVIKSDGSLRYKLEVSGAGQWRDETHLLIIPYEPEAISHRVWQFDALTGDAAALTDPTITPFTVFNADWAVSPTGEYIVFVNAEDQALWLLSLPPLPQIGPSGR